jgi:hypothetical protein
MTDRTTKALLVAIALMLFGNLIVAARATWHDLDDVYNKVDELKTLLIGSRCF